MTQPNLPKQRQLALQQHYLIEVLVVAQQPTFSYTDRVVRGADQVTCSYIVYSSKNITKL